MKTFANDVPFFHLNHHHSELFQV